MITLYKYQQIAVNKLLARIKMDFEYDLGSSTQILKAPTGAGKTVVLSSLINELPDELDDNLCFIWVSPGKGDLLGQSYRSVNNFIRSSRVSQYDINMSDISINEVVFVNFQVIGIGMMWRFNGNDITAGHGQILVGLEARYDVTNLIVETTSFVFFMLVKLQSVCDVVRHVAEDFVEEHKLTGFHLNGDTR